MFYLYVNIGNEFYWLHTEPVRPNSQIMNGKLHTCALYAEAFEPAHVEEIRQMVLSAWPGSFCMPVECSSNKIIPKNMRKIINLA